MKLKPKRRWPKTIYSILALAVCGLTLFTWAKGASLKATYFMGVRNMMIVSGATQVEAFRVSQPGHSAPPANAPIYGKSSSGVKLDSQTSARVTSAILNVHNQRPYFVGGWPDCEPTPGVAFRIWQDTQFVDFLPCFSCGLMAVRSGPVQPFDGQRSGLLQVSKDVFPQFAELEKM